MLLRIFVRGHEAAAPSATVTLTTIGRGKAPFHWLDLIQGKKRCA